MNENDVLKIIANNKTENKNIDYKETIKWSNKEKEKSIDIIKDILAMSNTTDGGKIIIGVEDKTFDLVGMPDEDFNSFDNSIVNTLFANYADPKHYCEVFKFNDINGKKVIVINVPEYNELPIICKIGYNNNVTKKQILQEGQIYIRTDSGETRTIAVSSEVMRSFLTRAISKKSDNLLNNIKLLLTGKASETPEDISKIYRQQIKDIQSKSSFLQAFDKDVRNLKLGYWELVSYPNKFNKDRLGLNEISDIAKKSVVSKRGWSFPIIDSGLANCKKSNTLTGVEYFYSYIDGKHTDYKSAEYEYYNFEQDGLFFCKKVYNEDTERIWKNYSEKYSKVLTGSYTISDVIEVIFSVMEFFIFFKRYYEAIADDSEDIHVNLIMHDCKDRYSGIFHSHEYGRMQPTKSNLDIINIKDNFKLIDLKINTEDCALKILHKIFRLFNSEILDEAIKYHQKRFMDMNL